MIKEIESELPNTGERLVTSVPPTNHTALEHLHRYLIAREICRGKRVLDIASGEGYGSRILAQSAKQVIGVDIAEDAVKHAQTKYGSDTLEFKVGSCAAIPTDDQLFDVVVSFETIEHMDDHELFFQEIKRVLKPDGLLIISTPDTEVYGAEGPKNIYHLKELNGSEFSELTSRHFKNTTILAQKCIAGSAILPIYKASNFNFGQYSGNYKVQEYSNGLKNATYLIAICSNQHLPEINVGIFTADKDLFQLVSNHDKLLAQHHQDVTEVRNQLAQVLLQHRNEEETSLIEMEKFKQEVELKYCFLNKTIAKLESHIAKLESQCGELNKRNHDFKQQNKRMRKAVDMWNSGSWLKRAFHKLRIAK